MTRENHFVKEEDIRPARPDGTCFYCRSPLYQEHKIGCVVRSKSVIVEVTFQLLKSVPEDWDEDMVNFHMNESSSCKDNLVRDLVAQVERMDKAQTEEGGYCMCELGSGRYIREATQKDEEIFTTPDDL